MHLWLVTVCVCLEIYLWEHLLHPCTQPLEVNSAKIGQKFIFLEKKKKKTFNKLKCLLVDSQKLLVECVRKIMLSAKP